MPIVVVARRASDELQKSVLNKIVFNSLIIIMSVILIPRNIVLYHLLFNLIQFHLLNDFYSTSKCIIKNMVTHTIFCFYIIFIGR